MMTKTLGGATLYLQVAEEIKKDLSKLRYGDQIPSEGELMERYGVSRGTVRQAVDGLVNSGYLYKLQGKGTFRGNGVPNYRVHNYISSFSNNVMSAGETPTVSDVHLCTVKADEKVAEFLCIPVGEEVWKLSRYRGVRGKALSCYAEAFISKEAIPALTAEDLDQSLIDMVTERFHIGVSSTTNNIYARTIGRELGEKVGIEPGHPILLVDFIMRDERERPFLYDWSVNWDNDICYKVQSEYRVK